MARRKRVTFASDLKQNQACLYMADWNMVFDALKTYQAVLNWHISEKLSIFHRIRCSYCRRREQCPEIGDLEFRKEHAEEIAGILADMLS